MHLDANFWFPRNLILCRALLTRLPSFFVVNRVTHLAKVFGRLLDDTVRSKRMAHACTCPWDGIAPLRKPLSHRDIVRRT